MYLRFISLYIDNDSELEDFKTEFNRHSRFISNFLSIQIRKIKFKTDGTFNMIGVTPSLSIKYKCRLVGDAALQARILFDEVGYGKMNEKEKYEYYLSLLEQGYRICNKVKTIPLDQLLELNQVFRENGYKNEWLHKQKRFKDKGIEVRLEGIFSSKDFILKMSVFKIETHKEIVSGTVIRTLPYEVCFDRLFKDVLIEDDKLIITESLNNPKFIFRLSDILNGKFIYEITDLGIEYDPISPN